MGDPKKRKIIMENEPQIASLSKSRRNILFFLLVIVFLITLPAMIFYTTGYRLSFDNEETSIVTTGGVYVTTDNLEVSVYLDDEKVESPRLFRSAYYIQNIEAGQHRIVVQRPDLQTWVKELPVDSHIVIEAAAFNMPLVPNVRPITRYIVNDNLPVFTGVASGTDLFAKSTTTTFVYATSSTATTSYQVNEEFDFVKSLFSTTSTSSLSVFERVLDGVERFRFATTTRTTSTTIEVEELVERGNMSLVERDEEIFAKWNGDAGSIPYYFCISNLAASTTAERYGDHVSEAFVSAQVSTTTRIIVDPDRFCRTEIKLDKLRQDVYFYNFMPTNSDLVLLQLEDGLYVTEIDDRAWQNSQLLYPGDDFRVVIENGAIYIFEGDTYFEIITQIEPI